MAYPNYYPNYYPQYQNGAVPDMLGQYKGQYAQQMPPTQMMPTQMALTNDLIFVLNVTEATSYPVAPGNSVTLWDKNEDTVYIKSVNAQGIPSMRILDYKERTPDNAPKTAEKHVCQCGNEFVRIEDFKALEGKFDELSSKVENIATITKAKTKNKEDIE